MEQSQHVAGERYVYSNQAYWETEPFFQISRLGGCRITADKFAFLDQIWIPDSHGGTTDLVPLKFRASSSYGKAGSYLTCSYSVFNLSETDPGPVSFSADIYLSTNDNISTFDTKIGTMPHSFDFGPLDGGKFFATGVQVPSTTAPGTYWAGVVLNSWDADYSKNDTDGWDADKITVTAP